MKVLLVSDVFPPVTGGSGRWLWELYRRLTSVSVDVVAGEHPAAAEFDRGSELRTVRTSLRFSNWGLAHVRSLREYVRGRQALRRHLDALRPDAIHCGKCLPEALLAMMATPGRRIPIVVYTHGEELTLAETSRELNVLTRFVLHRAARVIANSQHTRRILVERWRVPASRIVVIHPGVDTDRFVPAPRDEHVRERFGWRGRRVILTVGALQKRKGQDMLIRALPAIRATCPDVLYSIVGEGWERPYLEALAAECGVAGHVQFGAVAADAELVQRYQQCDLFALPNRQIGWDFEGFGIVLLEAQACGKAAVTGRSGGTAETILPGVTGQAIAAEEPVAIATAVSELLANDERRAQMGMCARMWVAERFDWRPIVTAFQELLP